MGKADKSMKAFLEIPEIFSQLFNVVVFGGKEEIKPEEFNQFQGDLKAFFSILPNRFNAKNLKDVIAKHRETWYAISTIKKDNRFVEYINSKSDKEIAGGVSMDVTLDYIEARGKREGINITGKLYKILRADNRIDDWDKALENEEYMIALLNEYALNDNEEK